MFKTRLTELLWVEYPIIGRAMAYLSTAELAAAVSNAGGFGLISSVTCSNKEELREQVKACRALTDKPFGVNVALITRDPSRIRDVPSVKELVDRIVAQAGSIVERMQYDKLV